MPLNRSAVQHLSRVFKRNFSAHDIAEPLASFDGSSSAEEVQRFMDEQSFEVVGYRDQGQVVGYLEKSELTEGPCSRFVRPFEHSQVILDSASLVDVVLGLREASWLFVSLLGRVGGIITRSDLQKPAVRMWLFGMVTLIEMRFTRLIERFCPDDTWKQFLSDGRVRKAEELRAERTRRNQDLGLLDCLQLADKGQIVARNEDLRGLTRFTSRREVERPTKQLEQLRNNLAHAQDIVSADWDTVVMLSENLDQILMGPPGLQGQDNE